MTDEIVQLAVDVYRRRGPLHMGVPVGAFLATPDAVQVQRRLAALLESGALETRGRGIVALAPALRLAVAGKSVVASWLDSAQLVGESRGLYIDAIRTELRQLVTWASGDQVPIELTQRAAELAGVLAMRDLDPAAMDVVAASGGTPRRRLTELRSIDEGSCAALKDLRQAISLFVSTIYVER